MGICSGISNAWLFIHCFQSELEFRNVVFLWREECQGTRRKKPSEHAQRQEPPGECCSEKN